jgi:hypothetical protein
MFWQFSKKHIFVFAIYLRSLFLLLQAILIECSIQSGSQVVSLEETKN